jgi:DNA-directed RNA polymerase subunit RPC12/RpoP
MLETPTLDCPKCKVKFGRAGKSFLNHVEKCGGIAMPKRRSYRYPCFHCPKKFVTKGAAADHMAEKHNFFIGNLQKMCFECKEEVEDMRTHVKVHNCPFVCPECGVRLLSKDRLEKHITERHENSYDRPFPCKICKLSFKNLKVLRSHESSVHTVKEENFVCDVCNRRYQTQFKLKQHILSAHTNIRR